MNKQEFKKFKELKEKYKEHKISMLTEIQKSFLAGLFAGEGYVGIQKNRFAGYKRGYGFKLSVVIAMTDKELIEYWYNVLPLGKIYYEKGRSINYKDIAAWRFFTKDALTFLELIQPYVVGEKKKQINLGIEFQTNFIIRNRSHLTDVEFDDQKQCYGKLKVLHGR